MKNNLFLFIIILIIFLCCTLSATGASSPTNYLSFITGLKYMCGDTFELTFPAQFVSTTRSNWVYGHPGNFYWGTQLNNAIPNNDEFLVQTRIKLKNLTPFVFHGFDVKSFQLLGCYENDSCQIYEPIIMTNYDRQNSSSDFKYYTYAQIGPLDEIDMLLVFKTFKTPTSWFLYLHPESSDHINHYWTYPDFSTAIDILPRLQSPCEAIFEIPSIPFIG